jgi:hypothetical protein
MKHSRLVNQYIQSSPSQVSTNYALLECKIQFKGKTLSREILCDPVFLWTNTRSVLRSCYLHRTKIMVRGKLEMVKVKVTLRQPQGIPKRLNFGSKVWPCGCYFNVVSWIFLFVSLSFYPPTFSSPFLCWLGYVFVMGY